jgi:hypothetical protein
VLGSLVRLRRLKPSRIERSWNRDSIKDMRQARSWPRRIKDDQWFWPALLTAIAAVIAAVMIPLGWITAGSRSDEASVELVKTGLQIAAVVVLGSAVAAAYRARSERRDHERRIDEYLAGTLNDLWAAYHRVKAVRRTLRASGFDRLQPGSRLNAKQSTTFHAQMDVLNDAQLTLERLVREISGQADLFGIHGDCVAYLLGRAEHYVNEVISDWEEHGLEVQEEADFATLTDGPDSKPKLRHLRRFLGSARPDTDYVPAGSTHPAADCQTRERRHWHGIKAGVSIPIERAAELIQAARLAREPPPPPPAERQLGDR